MDDGIIVTFGRWHTHFDNWWEDDVSDEADSMTRSPCCEHLDNRWVAMFDDNLTGCGATLMISKRSFLDEEMWQTFRYARGWETEPGRRTSAAGPAG